MCRDREHGTSSGIFGGRVQGGKRKQTRREKFLAEMERFVPWRDLIDAIPPVYPADRRERPPMGLERMLRRYFIHQ